MKTKLLLTCAAATLVAFSCTKSNEQGETPGAVHDGYVHANAAIDGQASTRSIADNSSVLTDIIFMHAESSTDGLTDPADLTFKNRQLACKRAADGKITFTTPILYNKTTNDYIYLKGVGMGGAVFSDEDTAGANYNYDGSNDILFVKMWNAGNIAVPKTTGMTFEHAMANLHVICKAKEGESIDAIRAAWGDISKIEVRNEPGLIVILPSGDVHYSLAAGAFPLLKGDYTPFVATAIPASDNTTVTAAAMLTPTDSPVIQFKITGSVSGAVIEKDVTLTGADAKFEAGKTHIVTFTFGAKDKNVEVTTSTINAWKTGFTGGETIENP